MRECVRFRFTQNGQPLCLRRISSDGVVLNSETDEWPRRLTLEFDADSPITRLRMDQVRQNKGWGSKEYKLKLSLQDGALVVTGVDPTTLPVGRYWFRLRIGDLILPNQRLIAALKENQDALIEVEVSPDPRKVELLLDSPNVDQQIQRVLAQSELDGLTLTSWLTDPQPRPSRKACLLNLLAKLRAAPDLSETLLMHIHQVFFADVDCCYAAVDGELFDRLKALARRDDQPFAADPPRAPVHRNLLRHIRSVESDADKFRLHSFSRRGNDSLRATVAVPPGGDSSRRFYAEFDIDLGAEERFEGFFVHLGEALSPDKPDHLKLRDKLATDQTVRDFLYYRVIDEQSTGATTKSRETPDVNNI
ncbi:MAG: hypothetical protein J2P21_22840 [Chloracidobacterium sp.]|nr:hypothetical protein [Chloracidobacterium sp.]